VRVRDELDALFHEIMNAHDFHPVLVLILNCDDDIYISIIEIIN
jgi:hypothetical protein